MKIYSCKNNYFNFYTKSFLSTLVTLNRNMTKERFNELISNKTILFDGGMGTELYKNGVPIYRSFDEINLTNPSLVKNIHNKYISAGADIIETNTFGANRFKLKAHQIEDKLYDINFAGAKLAKEVAGDNAFVAGAIGPLGIKIEPLGPTSYEETIEFFKEQAMPLIDGGVDLFILETFIYPIELKQAVTAIRQLCDLPIIAQITIDEDGLTLTGGKPETIIKEVESFGTDAIGINCSVGPQTMLDWLEKVRKLTTLPISIMPNAGKPKAIDGRNIYLASPEYFGQYAKYFIQSGANIIGGCCGTTPEHIRKMRNTINSLSPAKIDFKGFTIKSEEEISYKTIEKCKKSRLARRLHRNKFVTFVELLSPMGISAKNEIEKAKELYYYGIDVINIPDGPRASARMSALSLAVQIQQQAGIETVLHYTCRDRNVIGIQSDLLGAYSLGIHNILAITGDPPKVGNYPDATAVFDIDSIGLVNILDRLNKAMDIAGNPIGEPSGFFIGVGDNPGALNLEEELKRLDWKVKAGAEFIVTQPVFDINVFLNFYNRIKQYNLPLIAGIWPLASLRNAEFLNNEVPGCSIPDYIMERMRSASLSKESARKEGIIIAKEILNQIKPYINGVQISAPFGKIDVVYEILDEIDT